MLISMTPDEFLHKCPSLWHVAAPDSWERIKEHGFRTAEQLIGDAELDDDERARLLREPRSEEVRLIIDGDEVVLRDQQSLFARRDLRTLPADDDAVADWVRLLNKRSSFFTSADARDKMLDKYRARDGAQDLIVLSPMRVFEAAGPRIEISAQNTAAAQPGTGPQKRRTTFVRVGAYPNRKPAEVTVLNGLHVPTAIVRVERHFADGRTTQLYP